MKGPLEKIAEQIKTRQKHFETNNCTRNVNLRWSSETRFKFTNGFEEVGRLSPFFV
jgi:hypothetical protein